MTVYAESSAIVAWLFREALAAAVTQVLASADAVIASDLTLVESDRVLIRAQVMKQLDDAEVVQRRKLLHEASSAWQILHITPEIVERARQPFPAEPVRSLDAIHLSSALAARSAISGLHLLSLDTRIRAAAQQLGFGLQPGSL